MAASSTLTTYHRYFIPVLTKAGIRKIRLHDLRDSFGSSLIQRGAPLAYVKDQMGQERGLPANIRSDNGVPFAPIRDYPISIIPSTTKPLSSPIAAASVSVAKRLTSAPSLPARPSALKKFRMISGWSVLWIMIWGTSISILGCSNHSTTRSARGCYLCSRYILLPMSPGWTKWRLVGLSRRF
jgi:hypothetical protein